MATIDISLLGAISPIVVFLLFFVGGWGVLVTVNPFKGKGSNFYGLLAFLLAIIMVLTPVTTKVVMSATPWLILLIMIGFFLIFYAMMFGVKEDSIRNIMLGTGKGWLITLVVIVMLFALGGALGPGLTKLSVPDQASPSAGVDPNEPVFDANGNIVPAGSVGAGTTTTGQAGTATGDFGTNLVFTLFNPKVLGLLFLFILGTLTVIMLNT
jgi:hypothetical protein